MKLHSAKPALAALIAATLIAAAIFTLASCGGDKGADAKAKDGKEGEKAEATVFAVTTTEAAKGELKDYLEFGGDVAAKSNIDILPDAAGKISEVRVSVGDRVERNQVIAYVDPSRPGMKYEMSPVKSPIAGTITAVNVVPGSMVTQQISVGKVSKMEELEISMNVPERFVSKIKRGQYAYLRFDAYPGDVFIAKISEISPVLDTSSRTMAVKLELTERDPRIKAGMFARVKLITDTKSGIVKVPSTAIVNRFGEDFVFLVEGGETATVRKQIVKVGIRVDDKAEILEGVSAGDEIVVRGQTLLENGSSVNVVSRAEPLSATESVK